MCGLSLAVTRRNLHPRNQDSGIILGEDFAVSERLDWNRQSHLDRAATPLAGGDRDSIVRALREAHALLDTIYATAPIGLGFWDRDLRFVRVNQRLAEINGLPPEAHIGKTPAELLPGIENIEGLITSWRHILATGEPLNMEISGQTPAVPGCCRYWNESFYPVRVGGEIVGIGAVVEEVTERKRAEQAAREADRRKDEFLALLAHELRNPLAPIRNAVDILRRSEEPESGLTRIADMIERQVGQLTRMVDDLLDVSRIGQGKIALKKEPLELRDICRTAAETVRPQLDAKAQRLEIRLPDTPVWSEGDPVRLTQVLSNLLGNAVKFTGEGGRIALILEKFNYHALIRVRDNGAGMLPELLPRVFDLFTQGQAGRDRALGGLGIGLSLVKSLVELHGGKVEAHSDGPGLGSEFVVRLPMAAAPDRPGDAASEPDGSVEGLRILVVDDNRDAAESLAMMLELEGHQVQTAEDGYVALGLVRGFRPRVVLLDIGLPGMDGYQVARRLREDPEMTGLRIIAISGYGSDEDRELSRAAGFDCHLVKPVDPERLNDVLAELG